MPSVPIPPTVVAGRSEYESIELHMSRTEVESIMGGPPGYYIPAELVPCTILDSSRLPNGEVEQWTTCEGEILVGFDNEGKVLDKKFDIVLIFQRPNLFERLRAYVGL